MSYIIELSENIEGMKIISEEEYEEYIKVINLLDSENNTYFGSVDDWNISVKGFLRNLEFKEISEEELKSLEIIFKHRGCYGIQFYHILDKLKNAYKANDNDNHTYILSRISPSENEYYYRLYKQFELKTFEFEGINNKYQNKYEKEQFTTNDIEVWGDTYRFKDFTNPENEIVSDLQFFDSVCELVIYLNNNKIYLK